MFDVQVPEPRPRYSIKNAYHEPVSGFYKLVAVVGHALLTPLARRDWRHMDRVPPSGGVLVVVNHISRFDPLPITDFLVCSGRWPCYLAKASLFRSKLAGWILRATESIPVERDSPRAADSLIHARERLEQGKLVGIYPEGTETRDPDLWPMIGRTGAARLALETRVPVLPCAQWGAHSIIPPIPGVPRRLFGQTFQVICGEPLDLSEFYDLEPTHEVLQVVTTRMTDAIIELLEELRHEQAPSEWWDFKQKKRVPPPRELPSA